MSCRKGFVGAVAERRVLGRLAAAEPDALVGICLVGLRRQSGALAGTVAEGLIVAAPASAPEVSLARLDFDFKGFAGCDNWLVRHRLPSLPALWYCRFGFRYSRPDCSERPVAAQGLPMTSPLPPLRILLAAPRGFCAGVDRAIQIVEQALARYGAPGYVRHEIVHNRYVVEQLELRGAVFVEELDQGPDDGPVVFSAHGVPKSVPAEAGRRNLFYLDATCPLVSKVHREAERHHEQRRTVILIGHAHHPEVIGTMGQLPAGGVTSVAA